MDEISKRHVPTYFECEANLHNRDAVMALLADPEKGSLQDKARLAIVYILNAPSGNGIVSSNRYIIAIYTDVFVEA